jgi:hypothetical protein
MNMASEGSIRRKNNMQPVCLMHQREMVCLKNGVLVLYARKLDHQAHEAVDAVENLFVVSADLYNCLTDGCEYRQLHGFATGVVDHWDTDVFDVFMRRWSEQHEAFKYMVYV